MILPDRKLFLFRRELPSIAPLRIAAAFFCVRNFFRKIGRNLLRELA